MLKAKSEIPTALLKAGTAFTPWKVPSLGESKAPGFKQPIDEVEDEKEQTSEEIAQQQTEQLQAIKDDAFQQGFETGKAQGLIAAKTEIDQQKLLLTQLMDELNEPLKQCGEKTQQQLLDLAFSIARQIVRRELKQDPTQLIAIIREAINLLPISSQQISLFLHPEDALMVINTLSIDSNAESSRWNIKQDPSVERGSCQVTTDNSKIDASLDKQIAVLFNRVVGGLRAGEASSLENKSVTKATSNDAAQSDVTQTEVTQTEATQTDSTHTESNQAESNQAESNQTESIQIEPTQPEQANNQAQTEIKTAPKSDLDDELDHE